MRHGVIAILVGVLAAWTQPAPGEAAAQPAAAPQPPPPATQPAPGPARSAPRPNLNIPSGAHVAVIPITGEISGFTPTSVERRVNRALDGGASIIVFELDTPGGEINSAMAVSKYIKTIPVPTIAWVNNDAYSAGAQIASASDLIVMSPASAIGDAAPISMLGELAPTERAKVLSPWLAEFRDNARANDYDFALFHAMCVLGIEVYQIEHRDTGEVRFVNQADYRVMVEGEPMGEVISASSALSPEKVAAASVDVATDADVGRWKLVRQVHDGKTLLTADQSRAHELSLSRGEVVDLNDLASVTGAAAVVRVHLTWSEHIAWFFTNMWVRAILIILVLVCGYIEFQAPGVSGAGIVAGLAFVALIGAPYILGLAEIWHIILLLIGLALVLVEVFTAATAGVLAAVGALLMFIGLVLSVIPTGGGPAFGPISLPPSTQWLRLLVTSGATLAAVLVSFVGFYFVTQYFGRIPGLNRLILEDEPTAPLAAPAGPSETPGALRVGESGRALTSLHPTGQADFGGRTYDVVSAGSYIDSGAAVTVREVRGNRIVVDRA